MPVNSAAVLPTPPHTAEVKRLGDEIVELSALLDAATGRLLTLIREFDARGGWNTGFRSCAHWLAWRVGLDLGAARERVRVARALKTLPRLAGALARGELSYSKLRALTRVATPETEERLLAAGRAGTVCHVERIVREVGALLRQALAAAHERLYQRARTEGPPRPATEPSGATSSLGQQQADALALLAETALHGGLDPGTAGERYQVVVHVDAPVLADPEQPGPSVLEDGPRVSAETSQRLSCDASRTWMRHDAEGRVVEVGARTRTVPPALRRALQHRDQGCRFPGCGVRHGQGHHLRHWAQGGPTTLSNLETLCRRHHRAVHEEGYQVARAPDDALHFRRPDGRPLPEVPSPAVVPAEPVGACA